MHQTLSSLPCSAAEGVLKIPHELDVYNAPSTERETKLWKKWRRTLESKAVLIGKFRIAGQFKISVQMYFYLGHVVLTMLTIIITGETNSGLLCFADPSNLTSLLCRLFTLQHVTSAFASIIINTTARDLLTINHKYGWYVVACTPDLWACFYTML